MVRKFSKSSLKFLGGSFVMLGICKGLLLSINDDWDNITYYFKKNFQINNIKNIEAKPKVVILGSGWAALSCIQKLDQDKVDLVIVSPRSFFFYTPLLAGTATGTVGFNSIVEPIRWYCERSGHKGATFIQGKLIDVNIPVKKITCQLHDDDNNKGNSQLTLEYDHLVIAVGAEPATFGIPGVLEYSTFMKEVEDGIKVQKQILQKLEIASALQKNGASEEEIRQHLHWVIIGGGPTGVELTGEITDFIRGDINRYFPSISSFIKVTLIEGTSRLLGPFDSKLAEFAEINLKERGAEVLCNSFVTTITKDKVHLKIKGNQEMIDYGILVWAGGITSRPIVRDIAKKIGEDIQNSRYGLLVDKKFRVKGVKDGSIWALGDCSVSGYAPTAQVANQEGKYLGRLIRDTNLDSYEISKYKDFEFSYKGTMAYVGGGKGVAELTSLWDLYPSTDGQIKVNGTGAFAIWRSLYFSKLMSARNRSQVSFDWLKASILGRDISTPFMINDKENNEKMLDSKIITKK